MTRGIRARSEFHAALQQQRRIFIAFQNIRPSNHGEARTTRVPNG